MFDRITVEAGGAVPYCKEVHEYRAPTDKSVELLNEFQEKALANLISKERLDCNGINIELSLYKTYEVFGLMGVCRYDVNGSEHVCKFLVDRDSANPQQIAQQIAEQCVEEVARHITITLLSPHLTKAISAVMK